MPRQTKRQVICLSDIALQGYEFLAKEMLLAGPRAVSRVLTEFAEANTEFQDARPQQFKQFDSFAVPKVWNNHDHHRPRWLGVLPIDYLLHLARVHHISPYKIQAIGLDGSQNPIRWADRLAIGRYSYNMRVAPVIEAIGLHWLTPIMFPELDARIQRDRGYRRQADTKRLAWVGE